MMNNTNSDIQLARSITKAASRQTYYTIRFLVDPERVADAYRAYAYFRWVDDTLDAKAGTHSERLAFIERQKSLLEGGYAGEWPPEANIEERMLIGLIQHGPEKHGGLRIYLHNMMQVMAFDAERRGRLISEAELNEYTGYLASAVTEAMHYFIGHGCYSPHDEARYLAVTGAHITHMLRDTFDDLQAGYYNVPRGVLEASRFSLHDIQSDAYRAWVRNRVNTARAYFKAGREYLNQIESLRCQFAGLAYMARFEWLLDVIEKEQYCLRPQYSERGSLLTPLQMSRLALSSLVNRRGPGLSSQPLPARQRWVR